MRFLRSIALIVALLYVSPFLLAQNTITTVVGGGTPSGAATLADVITPSGIAIDNLGNLYIGQGANSQIFKVSPAGVITVFAGSTFTGFGGDGGLATSAVFFQPIRLTLDANQNLFVADYANNRIRRIDANTGIVTTFAGSAAQCPGGTSQACGDGGLATQASFWGPEAVAFDTAGNMFIADHFDARVRRVDGVTGVVTTVAGTGAVCGATGVCGDGGLATQAQLQTPRGVVLDANGNLFIADGARIRRVDATTKIITTIVSPPDGANYVILESSGNFLVTGGTTVYRVNSSTFALTTVAGTLGVFGESGDGGAATSALLASPFSVAEDSVGNIYIGQYGANHVRKVDNSAQHLITTIAGGGSGGDGGPDTAAILGGPNGGTLDPSGNGYIADEQNNRIRRVDGGTKVITAAAGTGEPGSTGDGGLALNATITLNPATGGVAADASGNVYFSDVGLNTIRRINTVSGTITSFAGGAVCANPTTACGDGGPATSAGLNTPSGIFFDTSGDLFIGDSGDARVRRVNASSGVITTVAGNGTLCASPTAACGDGGPATAANLNTSNGELSVAVDSAGNLFLSDGLDYRVRRVDAVSGIITTVAGNGTPCGTPGVGCGDGGLATSAQLTLVEALALDSSGNLFIADNNVVRRVDATTQTIATVAGNATGGFSGDGGPALEAGLNYPAALWVDPTETLFIADTNNNRIRSVKLSAQAEFSGTIGNFGSQPLGVQSAPQTVTLTNDGGNTLTISLIEVSGTGFASTNTCTNNLLVPFQSCTIGVTFTATTLGAYSGELIIVTNDPTNPEVVYDFGGTGASSALTSIALTPLNPSVAAGGAEQLTATGTYADGSTQNLTNSVTWSSSSTATATISNSGVATGVAVGATTIKAAAGSISASTTLTVTQPILLEILLSPTTSYIIAAQTEQFTATGLYSNGTEQVLTTGVTWSSSSPANVTISTSGLATGVALGTATIQASFGGETATGTVTVTPAGFVYTGSLNTARLLHAATLLNNGEVLVTGGEDASGNVLASAELYNPTTGTFTLTGSMNVARIFHTAALLNNGKVLIVGGDLTLSGSAEIYDPATGLFTLTGSLNVPRIYNTATLLQNGQVLVAGGEDATGTATTSAELYNPATGLFSSTGSLNTGRFFPTATLLDSGQVLIAGGESAADAELTSAELYNPMTGLFSPTGSLIIPTYFYFSSGTLLNSGMVLISGGEPTSSTTTQFQLYNPATGMFSNTGNLTTYYFDNAATLLNNGTVLVAGGLNSSSLDLLYNSASIYDPVSGTTTNTGDLNTGRFYSTSTLLNNGDVLVVGGDAFGTTSIATATAELYVPSSLTPANLVSIAVTPANLTIQAGTAQQLVATGTFVGGAMQTLNSVTWTTSNNSVASITNGGTNGGAAYGLTAGATTITACAGGACGSTSLTVTSGTAPTLLSIAVTPASPSIAKGTSEQFTATGSYSDGSTANLTLSVIWNSGTTGVGTISGTGLAAGVGVGTSTIGATSGSVSGSTVLTVTAAVLVSIAVTPVNPSVAAGLTQQFTATGTYSDSSTQNLTGSVTWSSGTAGVATVSGAGLATGVSAGTSTITATSGTISGATTLTVTAVPVLVSIAVAPTAPSVIVGQTLQLTATGTYSNSTTQNLTAAATWASSNTTAASIGASGLALGLSGGSSTITATSGGISGSASLTVIPSSGSSCIANPSGLVSWYTGDGTTNDLLGTNPPTTSNAVSYAAGEVGQGFTFGTGGYIDIAPSVSLNNQQFTLSAWVQPDGAGPNNDAYGNAIFGQNIDNSDDAAYLSWSATDNKFVFVFGSINTDIITSTDAFPPGQFYFVAGTYDGTTFSLYVNGVLEGQLAETKTIAYSTDTWTIGSSPENIRVQGFPRTWNGVIDEVQAFNRALALSEIQSIFAAGSVGECKQSLPGIVISTAAIDLGTVPAGETSSPSAVTITSTGQGPLVLDSITPAGNSFSLVNLPSLPMTLATAGTATFDVVYSPTQTGSSTGTVTITSSASRSPQTVALTGTEAPAVLVSVAVTPANPSIVTGGTQQFTATGTYSDGTTQNLTSSVTWSSGTVAVATISGVGLATGVSTGTSTITATATSSTMSGSTALAVTSAAPTLQSISVTAANSSVQQGSVLQFTATGTYSDSSTQNLTGSVTWSSSNTNIATISNTTGSLGLASGETVGGPVTITATLGGISGSTSLTVIASDIRAIYANYSDNGAPITIAWNPPFPDTNYTAVCMVETSPSDFLLPTITLRTPGSMTVNPTDGGSPAGTLDCIAIPDSDTSDIQHTRVAYSGFPATVTVPWTTAFPDTNYTAACTAETQGPTGGGFTSVISALSASSITVDNDGYATGTMHCIAAPDSDVSLMRHGRTAFASSPATVGVTWNNAFPNILYAAACSDVELGVTSSDSAIALDAGTKLAASITVINEISSGVAHCLAAPAIQAPTLASIVVTPANPSIVTGSTQQFTATGVFSDESTQNLTSSVLWASSGVATATISSTGLASALSAGTTSISATSGTIVGSSTLTVTAGVAVSFSGLTPSQSILSGTSSVLLGGIVGNGTLFPASGETVSITINGVTLPATIGSNGVFTLAFPTASIPASATPYPITYSYAGDSTFSSAMDSSTALTVNPTVVTTFALTVSLIGTGNGTVSDTLGAISCVDTAGVISGTCSANYPAGSTVNLTATPTAPSTFGGWLGACSGTGACSVTLNSAQSVTASFVPPPVMINLPFTPGANASGMATYNCPSNPNPSSTNPCLDPNAHALALAISQVTTPFTLTVQSSEVPPTVADGLCPAGDTPSQDFDCRFTSFFTYQTNANGDAVVPLCYPYANGNCVLYTVFYQTPGTEPSPSWYTGPINWTITWNNDQFVPPAPYTGSTPQLYEDPDEFVQPNSPYGTNCSTPMQIGNPGTPTNPPIFCQFVFDITTFFDPTKKVDAGIGGKTKVFSDFVVAFPPANAAVVTVTTTPDSATVTAGSPIGFTITIANNSAGTASNASLSDPLPAGTGLNWSITPAYTGPGTCAITGTVGNQVLGCSFGSVAPSASFSIHVESASSSVGSITNSATITAANQQILSVSSVTVQAVAVSFGGLTPSQSILSGTSSVLLGGIVGNGTLFPASGETVSITINGVTLPATIGSNGVFTLAFPTASIPASAAPYPITYSYAGDSTFSSAMDSSTTLTVNPAPATFALTVSLIGTGNGTVSDTLGAIHCVDTAGVISGTCSANYPAGSTVNLTATPTAPSTFGGWLGACSGTGACSVILNSAQSVTASFVPPPVMINLPFTPGANASGMATYNCPSNPNPSSTNPCLDPNAHALALAISQVTTPFALTVQSTEVPPTVADGLCPAGDTPSQDFDCRFTSFFTYQTNANGDAVVPLCYPYANGNCVLYTVFYQTPGTEPSPSWYTGPVNWTITWNNDQFVPPAPYTGSTPQLYEDPDEFVQSNSPYGTNCGTPMQIGNPGTPTNPPIFCQFVFDITTFFDPTKKVDAGIGGKTKVFSDFVVAFPPANAAVVTVTTTPDSATVTAGSPIGFTITIANNSAGTASNASLSDPLPTGTGLNWSITPAYTGPGSCTISGAAGSQVLNCAFGNLSPSANLSLHVQSPTSSAGTYISSSTVTASNQQLLSIGNITVQALPPAFSALTPSQSVVYGTAAINLSGTLSSGTSYPAPGETVSVNINGATQVATIGSNGAFTTLFSVATIPASATPYVITYSYAGDSLYAAASDSSTSLTVTIASQTVSLASTPASAVYGSTFGVSATATSGLPVSITVSGACSISGGTVTMTGGTGTCTITGSQPGNMNYAPASAKQVVTAIKVSSATSITANTPNPSTISQGVTVNFAVTGAGQPTGSVGVAASTGENCTGTLATGSGSCTLTFASTGVRTITASYEGDANFTASTSASVSQTVNAAASALEISPTSVDFGQVLAGSESTKAVRVTNNGTKPISIFDVDIRKIPGEHSHEFHASSECPRWLHPEKSCVIFVKFHAHADHIGTASGTLVIADSAAGSPQTVALQATTINPRASLNPSTLSFERQKVGTTSGSQTVTVTNTGTTPLILGTISSKGDFSITNATTCTINLSLAPSQQCVISVEFSPAEKGPRFGALIIPDNALTSPQLVSLFGEGK